MQKRHDDLLTARLESVIDAGVAHILWNELYRWYDVKKIAARTLRDLEQRWSDLTNDQFGPLMKVEGMSGVFLMAENSICLVYKGSDDE